MTSSVILAQAMSHTCKPSYQGWSLHWQECRHRHCPHGQTGADLKGGNAELPPVCTLREIAPPLWDRRVKAACPLDFSPPRKERGHFLSSRKQEVWVGNNCWKNLLVLLLKRKVSCVLCTTYSICFPEPTSTYFSCVCSPPCHMCISFLIFFN